MTVEPNAVEIEDLALLKLGTAPDGRERWQVIAVSAVVCPHANDYRAVFMGDRIKVINSLEIPWNFLFSGLDDLLFLTIDHFFCLRCFLHNAIWPIDAGDIGAKIQAKRG